MSFFTEQMKYVKVSFSFTGIDLKWQPTIYEEKNNNNKVLDTNRFYKEGKNIVLQKKKYY